MKARGEISLLIAPLVERNSIFVSQHKDPTTREDHGSRIYLTILWVIVLFTVGPVAVGLLVTRTKELQKQRQEYGGGEGPLEFGAWYHPTTIYLNRGSGHYTPKALVGDIEAYYMVKQTLIFTPWASDHDETAELDRRAVALVW